MTTDKLPKWAQQRIHKLEQDLASTRETLHAAMPACKCKDKGLSIPHDGLNYLRVPGHTVMVSTDSVCLSITIREDGDVDIHNIDKKAESFCVLPYATNAIRLTSFTKTP